MRVKSTITHNKLKVIYPFFFWKYCSSCNNEFKREEIWQYECGRRVAKKNFGIKKYLCFHCAPDLPAAERYIVLKYYTRPDAPPPPPKPLYE